MIEDTPIDPGRLCADPVDCPKAISSCTPDCTTSGGLSYTYTDYWTNNIMSYYRLCLPQVLTDGQANQAKALLMTHAGLAFLRDGIEPSCNNNIAEVGYISKYCQTYTPNPGISPIKDLRLDMRNELTGWEGSTKKTASNGQYLHFRNDYSNLSSVTIEPQKSHPLVDMILLDSTAVPPNYHPKNGLTLADIVSVGQHILAITPLAPPYAWIAADVTTSGSITTFDVVSMRKVFLGLVPDFPSGTWHFVPEHYFKNLDFETGFETFPFTAVYPGIPYPLYMDRVTLDMDDPSAADPSTWSFRGVKLGDVNCTMMIDGFSPPGGGEDGLVTEGSTGGGICAQNNDVVTVEVKASVGQALVGYQLGMRYEQGALQYLGNSAGNLTDYSPENFAERNGEIRTLWNRNDFQAESITGQKTLFKLHFKVLDNFCDLSEVLALDKGVEPSIFYDDGVQPMSAHVVLSYQKETPAGQLLSLYPNPATNSATFAFQLDQANMVDIRLSDYQGGVLTMSQPYNTGTSSYTFPNLSSLADGPLNYTVKIGNLSYSGILIKSQP
ncbi:MAG: hypothetical protein ACKVUS_18960 [Saprospiraceae bacterium]